MIRKIKSIGLFTAVALALVLSAAPTAMARRSREAAANAAAAQEPVFVLKSSGGETLPNGALVNVTGASRPEYLFKTKLTIEGVPGLKEVELECENYLEQGKIQRETATDTWRVVEVHPVEICEGEPWLEEGFSENRLSFSPPNIARDESTVELFRTEEAIRAEERKQAEKGEPVHAGEPRRCAYTTLSSKGTFSRKIKKPLLAKFQNKMVSKPLADGMGCYPKAKWKGGFMLTYKGQPVFAGFETPPSVAGVSPTEGPEAGETTVQIGGSGFTGTTAVKFGSTAAKSFVVNSADSITAVSPKGSGSVEVTVTTPAATSAATPADTFSYRPAPTVTEMTPKTGPETGGTEVTITGTNFTTASSVSFGATPASMVKVNSAESITAVSPPGTGTVSVTVKTAGGTSASIPADEFTY
jgi:IPT/TIG domain